jgi:hypothetical protein
MPIQDVDAVAEVDHLVSQTFQADVESTEADGYKLLLLAHYADVCLYGAEESKDFFIGHNLTY